MEDEYGSITIDNKNLLNDLLGLEGYDNDDGTLSILQRQQMKQNGIPYQNDNSTNSNNNNHSKQSLRVPPYQSNYLPQQALARKFYLESPTFTKGEDDIYRYVHSRISNADNSSIAAHNLIADSLDNNPNDNIIFEEENFKKIDPVKTHAVPAIPRIGSNKLLSDLAVASLPKRDFANHQSKPSRGNYDSNPIYENELLDSLDQADENNIITNTSNQYQLYNSQQPIQQQNIPQPKYSNPQSENSYQQAPTGQQQLQQQQQQPQQLLQHQQQQQQAQVQQFQPILPFSGVHPQSIPGVFVLPSPSGNGLPINYPGAGPQFIPIPINPHQQSAMFYQEPLQAAPPPMFYNTAYPLNFGAPLQNPQNPYYDPQQNSSYYNNQENDMENDPYQQYQDPYQQQYQSQYAPQFQQNEMYNQYPASRQPQLQPPLQQNRNGNRFEAQPLQPPMAAPRNNSKNNNNLSQQSGDTYELNSPESYNGDENDLANDFSGLKMYDNGKQPQDSNDEDFKRQQIWNKLQKARDSKEKGTPKKKTAPPLPPPTGSQAASVSKPPVNKKPPIPNPKQDGNYIEKNVEAIRNKENLMHRYPEKKYEVVHGKNLSSRVKNAPGSQKKPPHHLQPMDNYDESESDLNYVEYGTPTRKGGITIDLNGQEERFFDRANKKISIPLDGNAFKDKDHINLDINLRLVDFLENGNKNGPYNTRSSYDDFDVNNDPLARHIRHFETNISRSLPGSSGSLNKLKPLPPLTRRQAGAGLATYPPKPYSHQDTRLQYEHDYSSSYNNEVRSEDGYLAQLQKAQNKPVIKTYSLKDYRNFKKDALTNSNVSTGKLGFDYESDAYRQKVEITQKKNDYAERVKARNRIILDQKRAEDTDSAKGGSLNQQPQQPSKTQRAKEYVKNNVVRQKSATRPASTENRNNSNSNSNAVSPTEKPRRVPIRLTEAYAAQPTTQPVEQQTPRVPHKPSQIDLSKTKEKPSDTAIVRIRDPITSKVRTIYINDTQIEELSKRHEQDKSKVNNMISGNTNTNNNSNNNNNNSTNNNLNSNRSTIRHFEPIQEAPHAEAQRPPLPPPPQVSSEPKKPLTNKAVQEEPKESRPLVSLEPNSTKTGLNVSIDDDKFNKLMARHNNEKRIVNDFEASPYTNENIIKTNQINKNNNTISVE